MTAVSVYVVFASAEEAERIGTAMIEAKLAACINILGLCRSIYRWQGMIETATEAPAIFKTTAALADALMARVAELHSYDVPAIAVWAIDKLPRPYADWLEQAVD